MPAETEILQSVLSENDRGRLERYRKINSLAREKHRQYCYNCGYPFKRVKNNLQKNTCTCRPSESAMAGAEYRRLIVRAAVTKEEEGAHPRLGKEKSQMS